MKPRGTQAYNPWILILLALVYLGSSSQARAQGDFIHTGDESALRVSLDAPGGSTTEWSPGSAYELAAHVFTQSWEVWTNDVTGEIDLRNFENTPIEGATVSFTLDSGEGNFTTTVLTSDADGVTSTWLTLAGGSAVVRVEASPDGTALASTTMDVSCAAPPEEDPGDEPGDEPEDDPADDTDPEEWSYSHTETVIYPSLQFDDTGITLDAYTTSGVTASVIAHTWEVWTSNYGNTSVFNESQSPAEGAELSWSIESGDGSYNTSSGSTDTAGNGTATFQMGGSSSILRIDVTYAGSYTAYATLDASLPTTDEGSGDEGTGDEGTTSEEEWTYSHNESSVSTSFAIADGTDPSLLVPGQSYTITTTVNYESWEVWTSNWGSTQWVNYSAGPASSVPVWMGLTSAGNWQSVSSSFEYTDYNGQVQSTFTMTADPADFVSESNFYGTMALGSQYLHPGGTVDDGGGDTGGGDTGGGDTGGGDTGGGDTGGGDTGGGDTGGGDTGGGTTTDTFALYDYGQSVSLGLSWNGDTSSFDTNLSVTTWEIWMDATGATEERNFNYSTAYTADVQVTSEADVADPNCTIYNATASFGGQTATASGRVYNGGGGDTGGGDTGGGDTGGGDTGGGDTGDGDDPEYLVECEAP